MEQWGFYFNQKRCIGCKACVLACKAWNSEKRGDALIHPLLVWEQDGRYDLPASYENLPGSTGEINYEEYDKYCMKENWRRVYSFEEGTKPPDVKIWSLSISCNHCSNPACIEACPIGYIVKESEYGIVTVDDTKNCIGCMLCQRACPWEAPQFWDDPKKYRAGQKPGMTKCDMCISRIREGLKLACVASCIMRALDAGPVDELKERYPECVQIQQETNKLDAKGKIVKLCPNMYVDER